MNFKNKILFLLMLSVCCVLNAQQTDTISITQNTFYNSYKHQIWTNPLFYTQQSIKNYTFTQVNFEQRNLEVKRVQTAEKINSYNFATEGIFNLDASTRLFGDVQFSKQYEYGLGYNFSSERTENQNVLSPNYYYAPKKGEWGHQSYWLEGGLSKNYKSFLFSGKLFGEYKNSFRVIDPRPQIKYAFYGGEGSLGYNHKNHALFLSGKLSLKKENGTVVYMDDYQNAPVYWETFTRFSNGYGRILSDDSYLRFINKTLDKGFGFGYQFSKENWNINATYNYNKTMKDFYGKDAHNKVYLEDALIRYKYRTINHHFALNNFIHTPTKDYKLELKYIRQQGDNYSVKEQGQNYRMNIDRVRFNSGIIKKANHITKYAIEFGFDIGKHKYIDLLGYTSKKLSDLHLNLNFNTDFYISQNSKLNTNFGVNYYTVINEELIINKLTSENIFIDHVVLPDHAYDITDKLGTLLHLNYCIALPKNKEFRIFAKWSSLVALSNEYKNFYPDLNASNNNAFKLGIAIIY